MRVGVQFIPAGRRARPEHRSVSARSGAGLRTAFLHA